MNAATQLNYSDIKYSLIHIVRTEMNLIEVKRFIFLGSCIIGVKFKSVNGTVKY